jgi:rare lipoprotein A
LKKNQQLIIPFLVLKLLHSMNLKTKNTTSTLLLGALFIFGGCASRELDYTKNRYVATKSQPTVYQAPKSEQIIDTYRVQRATMRPYTVAGIGYAPIMVKEGDVFEGISSWYGPNFHDKQTSNGEIYNMYAYTAANKILPMNTMVKVTNLENGKTTIVRINDRGPFVEGRIIDLSNAAAHDIDMVAKGTAMVRLEILSTSVAAKEYFASVENKIESAPVKPKTAPKEDLSVNSSFKDITQESLIESVDKTPNSILIQVGAFKDKAAANSVASKFTDATKKAVVIDKLEANMTIYKVYIKPFKNYEEAKAFIAASGVDGFIVKE